MQTIHAGNMKNSALIRSQLEACKIGQKVKKILLKKPFSSSVFEVLSLFFFISPCACFFICAVVIFQIYKENCI